MAVGPLTASGDGIADRPPSQCAGSTSRQPDAHLKVGFTQAATDFFFH